MSSKNKILKQGVSGARVEKMSINGKDIVRKSDTGDKAERLIHQYEWLAKYQCYNFLPKLINCTVNKEIVSYDMNYYGNYKTLYEHAKDGSTELVKQCVKNVIKKLGRTIHQNELKASTLKYESYIKEKVENKIQECKKLNKVQSSLFGQKEIIINGSSYKNISSILSYLYSTEKLKDMVNKSKEVDIHGDLTAENILVNSENDFILLDPNQSNSVSNINCEFAKLFQSFHSQYEFMNNVDSKLDENNKITFDSVVDTNYKDIFNFLKVELLQVEGVNLREIYFHEAMHFCRMLPYQLKMNETNFQLYYANMIILFNKVMCEYEI